MATSNLAIDYDEILARVSFYLHGKRSTSGFATEETDNLTSIIKSGLRKFYYPQLVDPALTHAWSFLKPKLELAVQASQYVFTLPDDFGGMVGSLSFSSGDNAVGEVVKTSPEAIDSLRSTTDNTTGYPQFYAIRPRRVMGTEGQKWEVMTWPTPDGSYTLSGYYQVHPNALDTTQKYPYGGLEHSETILESCLAAAEQQLDGVQGVHSQNFLACLQASLNYDTRQHQAEYLGKNNNNGFARGAGLHVRHLGLLRPVTYNGVEYTG